MDFILAHSGYLSGYKDGDSYLLLVTINKRVGKHGELHSFYSEISGKP